MSHCPFTFPSRESASRCSPDRRITPESIKSMLNKDTWSLSWPLLEERMRDCSNEYKPCSNLLTFLSHQEYFPLAPQQEESKVFSNRMIQILQEVSQQDIYTFFAKTTCLQDMKMRVQKYNVIADKLMREGSAKLRELGLKLKSNLASFEQVTLGKLLNL